MASSKGEGKGTAADAEVEAVPASEEETAEEHEAHIRDNLRAAADAAVASAEAKLDKAQANLEGAEASVKKAEALRAELGEE